MSARSWLCALDDIVNYCRWLIADDAAAPAANVEHDVVDHRPLWRHCDVTVSSQQRYIGLGLVDLTTMRAPIPPAHLIYAAPLWGVYTIQQSPANFQQMYSKYMC